MWWWRWQELRCPECRVLVEVAVEELPPNILLMRILESMKSAPRSVLSQPVKLCQTVPHPSQPPGRPEPVDGPPLTQAPPPPTIQSFQSSVSYSGSDSTHGFTGGGGGGGGHSGLFGGNALSGTTLGGYSGSLGREGSVGHGGFNATVSGVTSMGNLSINLTPSTQSTQHTPHPLTTHQRQVCTSNVLACLFWNLIILEIDTGKFVVQWRYIFIMLYTIFRQPFSPVQRPCIIMTGRKQGM